MGTGNGEPERTADEIIEEAVGKAIEKFKIEHPETYKVLVARIENPVELVVKTLKRDALYQKLVADTERELDIARIIKAIADIAFRLFGTIMMAL